MVVSVSTSTLFIDNEIVGNDDFQVCVEDVVSTSTESIESNLLDIKKSPPYKAKAKGTLEETLVIVTSLELVHDNLPKNSEISGVYYFNNATMATCWCVWGNKVSHS